MQYVYAIFSDFRWLFFVEQSNEASKTNSEKIPHIIGRLNSLDEKKQR